MNKKTFCFSVNYSWSVTCTHTQKTHNNHPYFLSPWLSTRLLGQSAVGCLNFWPRHCSPFLDCSILQTLQTITGHRIAPKEAFLSPILILQNVSWKRLSSCILALLLQLSTHGKSLTSTRLLNIVSTERHKERGVNRLTLRKLPTAWTKPCKLKHVDVW